MHLLKASLLDRARSLTIRLNDMLHLISLQARRLHTVLERTLSDISYAAKELAVGRPLTRMTQLIVPTDPPAGAAPAHRARAHPV